MEELRAVAEPLSSSCSPEVSENVEAAVKEAVVAWETTCTEVRDLCTKYHKACDLWRQYRETSDVVHEWCAQMEDVANLEPGEAVKTVQVRPKLITRKKGGKIRIQIQNDTQGRSRNRF